MLRNSLRSAWRSLAKNRTYSLINITGLAAGIAACLLIGVYITHELSFDTRVPDRANVYRLNEYLHYPGAAPVLSAATGVPIAPLLKGDHSEIESYTRVFPTTYIYRSGIALEYGDQTIRPGRLACTDTNFATQFGIKVLEGRPDKFIRDRHSIALTRSLARRLFGDGTAAGKIINLRVDDTTVYPTVVSNVFEDFGGTSHLQLDGVIPLPDDFLNGFLGNSNWGNLLGPTYLRLRPNSRISMLDSAFTKTVHAKNSGIDLRLQPLAEIHTGSMGIDYDFFNVDRIDGKYIRIFFIVAFAIFVIACFNFINLTIAVAAWRGKEIAVKKIMGAGRARIVGQVLTEAFLSGLISLALAILLAYVFLPSLNQLLNRHIGAEVLWQPAALTVYVAAIVATTLFAGGYPALLISSSRIIEALKSKVLFSGSRTWVRNTLVTGQFVIAVVFITSLIVFLSQLRYLRNKDLGFSYTQIVSVPMDGSIQPKMEGIRTDLARIKGVEATAYGKLNLGGGGSLMGVDYISPDGRHQHVSVNHENASSDYISLFGVALTRGRNFSPNGQNEYIVNETLARMIGYPDPIGRSINLTSAPPGKIVGVVKDYNYGSLHNKIEPLLISSVAWGWMDHLYVKISTVDVPGTLAAMSRTLASFTGGQSPGWEFMDEHFRELYRTEEQAGTIIAIIGGLAIGIACLGLFGLAAFVIVRRAKEISIRKVLGASVVRIAVNLSASFLKWVVIAFVIAAPITWWFTNSWLQDFAYRIEVRSWMFAAAAVVAVGTALLTVGILAVKAAIANPVTNLRSE